MNYVSISKRQLHLESKDLARATWLLSGLDSCTGAPYWCPCSPAATCISSQYALVRNQNGDFKLSSYYRFFNDFPSYRGLNPNSTWWSIRHYLLVSLSSCRSSLESRNHSQIHLLHVPQRSVSFLFFSRAFVAAGPSAGNVLQASSLCGWLLLLMACFCSSFLAPPFPHDSLHLILQVVS